MDTLYWTTKSDYQINVVPWLKVGEYLMPSIKAAAETDPEYQRMIKSVAYAKRLDFRISDGLLRKGGPVVCV